MASLTARRPTLPGIDIAAGTPRSPLDQLELGMSLSRDGIALSPQMYFDPKPQQQQPAAASPETAQPIPSLNLNLFRSPSIYSVESNSDSASFASSDDLDSPYGFGITSEPEEADQEPIVFAAETSPVERASSSGPSTPRGPRSGLATTADSPLASGSTTPRGGGARKQPSTQNLPYALASVRSAISDAPFTLRDVPVRSARSLSVSTLNATVSVPVTARSCSAPGLPPPAPTHAHDASPPASRYPETATAPDCASLHGEQGSDWGDDEAGFEWLDTDEAPDAGAVSNVNSDATAPRGGTSRLRSAIAQPMLTVKRSVSVRSGRNGSARSPLGPKSADLPNTTEETAPAPERRRTKKHPVVIPRRPAPPPPPGVVGFVTPVEPTRSRSPAAPRTGGQADRSSPQPSTDVSLTTIRTVAPAQDGPLPPVVIIDATPPRPGPQPSMVPVNDSPSAALRHQSANSLASSYSFYAFDDDSPPRSAIAETIPRGRYAKIALDGSPATTPTRASAADVVRSTSALQVPNLRADSPSPSLGRGPSLSTPMTPDELVSAGLERREAGDLPKSAWLFMKAAQDGSTTGRIHYGEALKYG